MKRTHRFTLIELLVVIAIIAILAGLLFPAIMMARNKAKEGRARTEIKALETALAMYESTYGAPVLLAGDPLYPPEGEIGNDKYDDVIAILQDLPTAPGNTRGIRMLDINNDMGEGVFLDPWKQRYRIAMDVGNFDGRIPADSSDPPEGPFEEVFGDVAIWSIGRDGEDAGGSREDDNDDINSWDN